MGLRNNAKGPKGIVLQWVRIRGRQKTENGLTREKRRKGGGRKGQTRPKEEGNENRRPEKTIKYFRSNQKKKKGIKHITKRLGSLT